MNSYRWADLRVGLAESFETTVTVEAMRGFAEISGDHNPLHLDNDFARASGFPSVVVFGLLTSGYYSRMVGMLLPGKFAVLHGIDIDFKSPVFVGDNVRVHAEIRNLSDAYKQIELAGKIVRISDGKTVSKSVIRVGLHER